MALEAAKEKTDARSAYSVDWNGDRHPLSAAPAKPSVAGAHEIVTDRNGQPKQVPLSELKPGDHTIELSSGREFMVHVPVNDGKNPLPVMMMFSGSAHAQYDPKNFAAETGMSTAADNASQKFMTVYAMPKEHLVGTDSTTPAYAWNSDGVLLGTQDEKSAGYDDLDYVKSIVNLLPQLGNIDTTHKTWAAAGFSQGGLMLNEVVSKIPGLFPTVDFVGTSMEKGYPYTVQPGNAMNVGVVQLLGDHETLPMPGNGNFKYKAEQDLRSVLDKFGDLGKAVLDRVDPLAPIQNDEQHQSPALLESFYVLQLARQGIDSEQTTSAGSQNQDVEKVYKPADANNHNQLTVFDVKNSDHNWPGPDPTGAKTNGNPKDTEFNTTLEMVNIWQQYNAKK